MNKKITVNHNGAEISAVAGLTVSEIISGEMPCGGHGRCGKCRVIARGDISEPTATEKALLSADELAKGVRLACLTRALGDCEIETLSGAKEAQIVTDGALPDFEINPSFSKYGAAIDIGTTTLAARLYDKNGKMLADTSLLNPQREWGADVISRIEAALDGKARELMTSVTGAIDYLISELSLIAGIDTNEIDGAVITGNTVMLSLLVGESAEPFARAPFKVKRHFGEIITAGELGLSNLTADVGVYLPRCISAFVGADITCAILATRICDGNTAMLADIGTNGEMALWYNGGLTVSSTAAGPAFEGVGISMGMRAAEGAIDRVNLENGELNCHVIGDIAPLGICGSGLIDAVAHMLDAEIVDESGYLDDDYVILSPVSITPKDIRMLQLAKSAICAGLTALIEGKGLKPSEISRLYIAGGFGNYLNRESAARIGLLPTELAERSIAVGNAALTGASMLLLNAGIRDAANLLETDATVLDLSTDPVFSERYMSGMMLEEV